MVCRPVVWSLLVGLVVMAAGCHDGSSRSILNPPAAAQPKMSLSTTEAIRKHNENAELVQAIQALPSITVSSPAFSGAVRGRMALERPKNFKLEMRHTSRLSTVADIGSNDDEFWFWTLPPNKRENAVYVCSYDDFDRTPLSAGFQPDWIIEAMGLRTISADEARRMETKPGDVSGTIKLVSTRRGAGGETLRKVTIIDPSGNVKEHQLFQGNARIASAVITEYQRLPGPDGKDVTLPKKFKLEWVPEKLALDIDLDNAKILPTFTADRRREYFSLPEIPGSKRVNLADYTVPASPASSPRRAAIDDTLPALPTPKTRSSRPAPPTGAGVQLEAPESARGDVSPRASRGPISLSADLDPVGSERALDQVVRPGLPRAVEP
jgi:hypothetical protein